MDELLVLTEDDGDNVFSISPSHHPKYPINFNLGYSSPRSGFNVSIDEIDKIIGTLLKFRKEWYEKHGI